MLAARVLELVSRWDLPVGHRLTEQALADELDVSRSPVRKALQFLEQVGAVESIRNRGFFVTKDSAELRRMHVPQDDESDEATYMRIADDRLSGLLSDEVSEADLMDRYGLTRPQVQRVLNRMAREQMAERKPGRGWTFRPILNTVDSHRESYRFRMIIEPAAILEPTFRIDPALFDRVRKEQEQLLDGGIERWTAAERFRAGSEFHEALVACSNNRFLIDALRTVNQSRRLIEYHSQTGSVQDRARMRRQCEEHLELLDMLEAGDRLEASHRLRQHLDVVRAIKTGDLTAGTRLVNDRTRQIEVHL